MKINRAEYIKIFEENMCAICHSKYCRKKIKVKNKDGVISTKCRDYNVQRRKREDSCK